MSLFFGYEEETDSGASGRSDVCKAYVDAELAKKLNLSGELLSGNVSIVPTPTTFLHLTPKSYVDHRMLQGCR